MAYRLIAVDMDDTLLDSEKQVSESNKKAILAAKEKGMQVVLASGRAYKGMLSTYKELGLDDYIIASGGHVLDRDMNVVHAHYLPPLTTKQIMLWASLRNIYFQVYPDEGYYYLKRTHYSDLYEKDCGYSGIEDPNIAEREDVLASKLLIIDTPENLKTIKEELGALFPDIALCQSKDIFLEVTHPNTSKGEGLQYIAGKLGLDRQQIIAVGDNEIDLSMIEYAGLGVAVKNAIPSVLEAADVVVPSNEESGVAEVIQKYMLI